MYPNVRQLETVRREARETQRLGAPARFALPRLRAFRPKAQPQPCGC